MLCNTTRGGVTGSIACAAVDASVGLAHYDLL